MKMIRNAVLLTALSSLWACSSSGDAVDIGDSKTGQKLEDYAAVWEGYAEAYTFADGSDRVRLTLDAEGNGSLEIGDSPALPVATDPDVGYPASLDNDPFQLAKLFPGALYPIETATVAAARVQLSINPWQIESDWCALQTSFAVVRGGATVYQCLPGDGAGRFGGSCTYFDGEDELPVDCAKRALCTQPNFNGCACDATSCSVYQPPTAALTQIDAALEDTGDSLVGTLKFGEGVGPSTTVRLKRLASE